MPKFIRAYKNFILPISILSGTIIGAGIFSLPYVFSKSGIVAGMFFLVIFCAAVIFTHLMYADAVVKSGDNHRFAGIAHKYSGKIGYVFSILISIIQEFLILTIYLVLSASFLKAIFPEIGEGIGVIIFWAISSIFIFAKSKRFAIAELAATIGIIGIILFLGILGSGKFFESDLAVISSNPVFILMPFGALLFALGGRVAIPTVIKYFREANGNVIFARKTIIWGTVLPAMVYALFVVGIIGISGKYVSPDTVSGIIGFVPRFVVVLLGILGLFSLWSSYFAAGLDIKNSLRFDFRFSNFFSALFILAIPFALYFFGFRDFIQLVEISGGILGGLEGILIISIWKRIKGANADSETIFIKKYNPIVYYSIMAIFIVSILYVFLIHVA